MDVIKLLPVWPSAFNIYMYTDHVDIKSIVSPVQTEGGVLV